jgi:hypothetical protein
MENNGTTSINTPDRRAKPRIACHYPAVVRGQDVRGEKFQVYATLENLSASGLYLSVPQKVALGERLFVFVRLSSSPDEDEQAPQIATFGKVKRSEPKRGNVYGVAVQLYHYRFL